MRRARGLQLLPGRRTRPGSSPLEDNEAEAALAACALRSMLTKGAMPVTVATKRWTGNFSSRVKTPFGRRRRETASPTRSVQSFGVSSPCGTSSRKGLVRGGDDRIGTLDAIEPDGAVLSRREGVGDLGLQAGPYDKRVRLTTSSGLHGRQQPPSGPIVTRSSHTCP
jgi:hypothetical protein